MPKTPDLAPIFLRAHTRVNNEEVPNNNNPERPPDVWARFAMVLDCETTVDIRQDVNFLWWRFCELKNGTYVCQQEGVVYADGLDKRLVKRIRDFVRGKRADVEESCPKEITIRSRTEFVNGEFWDVLSAGAVIVCFNSPFDLSRLALTYKKARRKNTGWSMMLWKQKRKQKFKPSCESNPKTHALRSLTLQAVIQPTASYTGDVSSICLF